MKDRPPQTRPKPGADREQRLARALRANLRRRKQASKPQDPGGSGDTPATGAREPSTSRT